ncbi:MAG TPA: hypothetical protein VFF04_05530 [Candidatus Babeliales bacterium]|nr:hypothetical protein [Candidatus Babeliales bacterium]
MKFNKKSLLILIAAASLSVKTECADVINFIGGCIDFCGGVIFVACTSNIGKDIIAGGVTGFIAPAVGRAIHTQTKNKNASLLGVAGTIALGSVARCKDNPQSNKALVVLMACAASAWGMNDNPIGSKTKSDEQKTSASIAPAITAESSAKLDKLRSK